MVTRTGCRNRCTQYTVSITEAGGDPYVGRDGGADRGLGYRGLGGLPRDIGVKVVAGCSGIGGEVEAVLEGGGGGRADVARRALGGRGCPRWAMRACAEGVIRYGAGV